MSKAPKTLKNPKLTDAQLVILSAAAARDDGMLLPLPSSLTLNKGAATLVLESLVRKELAAEHIASLYDETWRLDDAGDRLTLVITGQGLAALGIDEDQDIPQTAAQSQTDLDRSKSTSPATSTNKNTTDRVKRPRAPSAPNRAASSPS